MKNLFPVCSKTTEQTQHSSFPSFSIFINFQHFEHWPFGNPYTEETFFSYLTRSFNVFLMNIIRSFCPSLQFHPSLLSYCPSWDANSFNFRLLGPFILLRLSRKQELLRRERKQFLSAVSDQKYTNNDLDPKECYNFVESLPVGQFQ